MTENAAAALPMLRVPTGRGWEHIAPTLSSGEDRGEMILSGWDDRVVRTRLDLAWLPEHIVAQLNTSPMLKPAGLQTLFGEMV